jgi:hypothetical protein
MARGEQQGIDGALGIRAARQAEQAAAGVQAQFVSPRSLSATESNVTFDARAVRLAAVGSQAGDEFGETDTALRYRWTGTAWAYTTGIYVAADAARLALTISSADNGALFYSTDTGILWKVVAGAWVNEFVTVAATTQFKVGANKVVGARGAAVADVASPNATDLASVITLANEIKAQLNTAFARLRSTTGHGLWT